MNATKKAPQKRAAFAIEDAIAETRKRIGSSAKELQQKAQAALSTLQTERDGRLFAMDALERLKDADADEAAAYPHFSGPIHSKEDARPFRTGPQWPGFKQDLFRVFHEGTEAAQLGFSSIVTCVIAGDIGKDIDHYRELERAGKFLAWGTLGTEYAAPKVQRKTKATLKAEQKAQGPRLAKGEPEAIEQFLKHSGPTRRAAFAFLSKPYAEMAKAIRTADTKTAEAFAALLVGLDEVKENYLTIALHIACAASEIKRANVEAEKARG